MTTRTRRTAVFAAAMATALMGTAAGCGREKAEGPPDRNRAAWDGAARQHAAAPDGRRARPRPFTLVASGDILAHDSVIRQAREDAGGSGHDFRRMLSGAKPVVSPADLAICHMETVYGPPGGPFTGYPSFKTPPQVAAAIKDTGYESCSTASNHSLDAGAAGVRRTLDTMDKAGLKHVGTARSAAERRRPAVMRAGGATVAQLSYTYGTNGIPVPEKQPWLVNPIDPERVIADARAARRAGADIVVASLHWGTEWQEAPDGQQLSVAEELTRSRSGGRKDIDLIIGTHAHVPQAYEKVNGTWVVYGMGDQLAGRMNDPRGSMGSVARFTFVPPRGRGGGEDGDARNGSARGPGATADHRRAADRRAGGWSVAKAEFVPFFIRTSPRIDLVDLGKTDDLDDAEEQARRIIRKAVLSRGAAKQGLREGR